MTLSALEIAELAGGTVSGDGSIRVDAIAAPSNAASHHLVFVEDAKLLDAALASAAGVVIAGPFASGATRSAGAMVVCGQPRLAFARAGRRLHPPERPAAGIHPSAIVDPAAALGAGVSVGPHAVVAAGVTLGDRVVVEAGVRIGHGVTVGEDSVLKPDVVVYPSTVLGARVIVHAGSVLGSDGFGYVRDASTGRHETFPQVGCLVIEDDVEIGALCTVDRGALGETRIKRGAKLDNQVHLAHNVSVGEDVVIAAQTGVAGSSVIEDQVMVAGQVGIADHVRIESGAILGAQCGVPSGKVIKGPGTLFWGTPARPIKQYLRELAILSRMAKK
jgi:UDP-3-O-[3-hydroxymyristoyl] glucosamine N-acyltransferase